LKRRTITIREEGSPAAPDTVTKKARLDASDILLALAFLSLEAGTALIYRPAALLLAGVIFALAGIGFAKESQKGKK
jgi:hypothetical protein